MDKSEHQTKSDPNERRIGRRLSPIKSMPEVMDLSATQDENNNQEIEKKVTNHPGRITRKTSPSRSYSLPVIKRRSTHEQLHSPNPVERVRSFDSWLPDDDDCNFNAKD